MKPSLLRVPRTAGRSKAMDRQVTKDHDKGAARRTPRGQKAASAAPVGRFPRASTFTTPLFLLAPAAILLSLPALAAHDEGVFELEGNIADSPANGPDWGSIFDANGNVLDLHGGLAAGFAMDDISPAGSVDHTVFTAGGTKNSQNPACPWQWGSQSVPAKDDLSNVYAFGTLDSNGNFLIYAGLERLAPNGASHFNIG